jgi:hypothetical protein
MLQIQKSDNGVENEGQAIFYDTNKYNFLYKCETSGNRID